MSMKCPYCEQDIDDGSSVCPICGRTLEGVSQTADTAPEGTGAEQTAAEAGTGQTGSETGDVVQPAEGTAVAEVPAKNKGKKTAVIAAVIAVVAVVAVGAAVMMPKKSPKDRVIDAFKGIVAEGQTDPMEEIFGWDAMSEKYRKENSEVNMTMKLEDSSDPTIKSVATARLGIDAMNDVAGKKMAFNMGAGYGDMDIASLKFYLDDKQMIAAIPEISAKAFTLNYADDLAGQIAASPYLGQMFSDAGLNAEGFGNYLKKCNEIASSEEQLFDFRELWNRYKEGSKAIDDLKTAMTVEDAEKKAFTINGKEENCTGYNVTISKDALIQFVTTTKEFFLKDETLKKDFTSYMSLILEMQGSMTMMSTDFAGKTPEELQAEAWTSADEGLDKMIEQLKESMGDVKFVVYVTKDDHMASFDYSTTAKIENEEIKLYGTVGFAGGYSMLSNVNATLNMGDSTGDVITFEIDKKGQYEKGKSFTGDLTATMSNGSESYGLDYNGTYAVDTGDYSISLDVQADKASVGQFTSTGLLQNVVKGESLEIIVDSAKVSSSALSSTGEEQYVDLSGSYKVGPLASSVEVPEGESFDILAATEDDWMAVSSEVIGNVFGLMGSFY